MDESYAIGVQRLNRWARLAAGMIWGYLGSVALVVLAALLWLGGMLPGDTADALFAVVLLLGVLAFVASAVVVGCWIYRAHANLVAAAQSPLEFTPAASVWWFLVPFANLVKPYEAMRELLSESLSHTPDSAAEAEALAKLWWGTFLAGETIAYIGSHIDLGNGLTVSAAVALAASGLVRAASAWNLRRIIRMVTHAQAASYWLGATFA